MKVGPAVAEDDSRGMLVRDRGRVPWVPEVEGASGGLPVRERSKTTNLGSNVGAWVAWGEGP